MPVKTAPAAEPEEVMLAIILFSILTTDAEELLMALVAEEPATRIELEAEECPIVFPEIVPISAIPAVNLMPSKELVPEFVREIFCIVFPWTEVGIKLPTLRLIPMNAEAPLLVHVPL